MDRDCENCRNYKWNNGYKSCCKWTCKPDYAYEDEEEQDNEVRTGSLIGPAHGDY